MAVMRREAPSGLVRAYPDGRRPDRRRSDRDDERGYERDSLWSRPLTTAILAALAVLVAYQLLSGVATWAHVRLDDLRYGYPRSYQVDGFVGFGESNGLPTHVVALNLHRQVEMLVIAGDDPSHVSVIKGPQLFGSADDLAPVTVRLVDVNADGYPDLVLAVASQQMVWIDEPHAGRFRPLLPQERFAASKVLGGAL